MRPLQVYLFTCSVQSTNILSTLFHFKFPWFASGNTNSPTFALIALGWGIISNSRPFLLKAQRQVLLASSLSFPRDHSRALRAVDPHVVASYFYITTLYPTTPQFSIFLPHEYATNWDEQTSFPCRRPYQGGRFLHSDGRKASVDWPLDYHREWLVVCHSHSLLCLLASYLTGEYPGPTSTHCHALTIVKF